MCNPFTDKDLDGALKDNNVKNRTSAVYKACTGGEQPCCGTCICDVRARVDAFNRDALLMVAE